MDTNEMSLQAKDINQQGGILAKARNVEAAIEKFNKAMEIDPMLIDTYKNYADLFLHIEKYEEAINYYKKALLIEKMVTFIFNLEMLIL